MVMKQVYYLKRYSGGIPKDNARVVYVWLVIFFNLKLMEFIFTKIVTISLGNQRLWLVYTMLQ